MATICGEIIYSESINDFDDDSKLWEFQIDGQPTKHTCRVFNDTRHPIAGDTVLVFLMADRNHASRVVFDAPIDTVRRLITI